MLRKFIHQNLSKIELFIVGGSNQAISSLTNFLVNLYLLSIFEPENFGLFGVGFVIILFIGAIVDALFLTQMVIFYPSVENYFKTKFNSDVFFLLKLFSLILLLIMFLILFLQSFFFEVHKISSFFITSVTLASISYFFKDFLIRLAFNERKEIIAVYIHTTILIITFLLYLLLYISNFELLTGHAFIIFGFAHFVGIIIGTKLLKLKQVSNFSDKSILKTFFSFWIQGKWACISNVVMIIRIYAYTIVAATIFDLVAVANLNASRLFLTPAIMFFPVIVNLAMPRFATLKENKILDIFLNGNKLTLLFVIITLVYSIILIFSYDFISVNFLNENYQNIFSLVFLWCIYGLCLAIRNSKLVVVQVLQKFKKLSFIYIISTILTLTFSYLFSFIFGMEGIIKGLIIGEIVIILFFIQLIRKEKINLL